MRRVFSAICFALLVSALFTPASAVNLTLTATPSQANIGDTVTLSGSVAGITTIAVYLFVIGPGLDSRGVTLENLNIPAGRGLFTTAPVNLSDGSWTYRWDTSVILGTLAPGTYTIYVSSSPVDRLRYQREDYATTAVDFLPGNGSVTPAPLDPVLPVFAVGIAAILCLGIFRMREKGG
jgi:hypothetical protein